MTKRVLIVAGVAVFAALVAAYFLRPPHGVPEGAPTEDAMADEVGAPVMQHVYNGHVTGRSGEVYLVPKPYSFMLGQWDLTTLGTDTPTLSTTHSNPWAYLTRVPIVFYGPGYVPSGTTVERPVDISGLAPTYARLLGMSDFHPDGSPFDEIAARGGRPAPKLIFTLIIDGGGWNALQMHPDSLPHLAALRRRGTTYANATIGSAPSITGALHSTFGTGDYPREHGIPGNQMRNDQGEVVDTWLDEEDPRYLRVPTVSDVWDKDNGNKPVVGAVAYEGWHLGMLGHGSFTDGGDKDIAVVWDTDEESWSTNPDFYTLPSYLQSTDLSRLESYESKLDPRDGLKDGNWFGHTLDQLQEPLVRPGTPAFVRFTGDAAADVLTREPFGEDKVTDLMWVEIKAPDYAGHAWNVTRPEQGDVLAETDAQIARFKRLLDDKVGKGNYVLAISADHGQQPLPDLFGGWRINNIELQKDIDRRFGDDLVMKVTPVDIYFDLDKVKEADVSLDDVARFLGSYTLADNTPDGIPGADRIPEARLDETLFAGAFTDEYIESLTPERIAGFGDSTYPEGTFVKSPGPSPSP